MRIVHKALEEHLMQNTQVCIQQVVTINSVLKVNHTDATVAFPNMGSS